ncbi:N-acetyltransferase [Actinoalloteichus sp. AHMU CJ021]|uniref:Protein N-acetyltransferase, RimJ/RimL family n=1 Tax=Actinoalloteichus caeruleus DSM 43889 TaxID=1120930 RepID=A0ABT1JKH1_ACTCY|nr:GNAT family protein [Actinoalloteichus caeruleus]AUS78656.1 N-acetyltransferase [Actinoalloteichus sp. AHMU CJ021]MCP2332794.1 Protein N-acetyltransferase, RimJ/RimL family [Actinoalloteichus caeruleus DSM 43889]
MSTENPWPLGDLALTSPRLELRPDDDEGLRELVELARQGIHPPERMPFTTPWTDVPAHELGVNTVRFHWRQRAEVTPTTWAINFLVRLNGTVVGVQQLAAANFPVVRTVVSGSWLGIRHQGRGLGTEARAAVLSFAFDHLGARLARTGAFEDNPVSAAVSRRLGYREDGTQEVERRGELATIRRFVVSAEGFDAHRPEWRVQVAGLDRCRDFFTGWEHSG